MLGHIIRQYPLGRLDITKATSHPVYLPIGSQILGVAGNPANHEMWLDVLCPCSANNEIRTFVLNCLGRSSCLLDQESKFIGWDTIDTFKCYVFEVKEEVKEEVKKRVTVVYGVNGPNRSSITRYAHVEVSDNWIKEIEEIYGISPSTVWFMFDGWNEQTF